MSLLRRSLEGFKDDSIKGIEGVNVVGFIQFRIPNRNSKTHTWRARFGGAFGDLLLQILEEHIEGIPILRSNKLIAAELDSLQFIRRQRGNNCINQC